MQPIPYDVRNLHIYSLDTAPRPGTKKGYVDKRFTKSADTVRMYFRPTSDTMAKEAQGQTPNVRYRVVINKRIDIKLGDRIGDDNPQFEVVSILSFTNPPQHQMEVKEI